MMKSFFFPLLLIAALMQTGCNFLFGTKKDKQVAEVFEQGRIDPRLVPSSVGYVPVLPFWSGFQNPVDVYVGYDEMIYVVDDKGLHVLDQKGVEQKLISFQGATDVVQDRRLHTYVAARIDYDVNNDGITENVAAVFHLMNTALAGAPVFVDTLIHPFCDNTRVVFKGAADMNVQFTGLATLADNTLLVARTGPTNDLTSSAYPDNTVLFYKPNGSLIKNANGLNSTTSSLKSVLKISSICSFAAPPQQISANGSNDFIITQTAAQAEYKTLWMKYFTDPDAGSVYSENADLLNFDKSKASRFLYESFRFKMPADVCVATDASGYIFVVDAASDSLYQFTQKGFEGVNAPATSSNKKQVLASFGGPGVGPFNFNQPCGVAYFRKMVYVADKGNGRICRFKLSTDLE